MGVEFLYTGSTVMQSIFHALQILITFLLKVWRSVAQIIGSFILLGLLFLIIAVVIAGSSPTKSNTNSFTEKELIEGSDARKIVVLPLNGEIVASDTDSSGFGLTTGLISADAVLPVLQHLTNDDSVKAVVLHINSPGGAVVATDELYRAAFALRGRKPIIAVFRDVAASGGYYLAMASHQIVANPATITGSIGVITQTTELAGLYEKLGVQINTFKSGEFKDIGSPNRSMTPAEQAIIQSVISDSYEQFLQAVASGRNWDMTKTRSIADGRIVSGKQAYELGMIDELGGLDRGIELARELSGAQDASVVEYSLGGWLESILGAQINPFSSVMATGSRQLIRPAGLYYLWE